MKCDHCEEVLEAGDEHEYLGKKLCEDCYIEVIDPPRTCDVAAVHSAKKARQAAGHTGTDGLTELQKDIYNFIKEEGKVLPENVAKKLKIAPWQVQKQIATLRHCELVKGTQIDGEKYLVIMEGGPGTLELD